MNTRSTTRTYPKAIDLIKAPISIKGKTYYHNAETRLVFDGPDARANAIAVYSPEVNSIWFFSKKLREQYGTIDI